MSPARPRPSPAVHRRHRAAERGPGSRRTGSGSGSANGWPAWIVTPASYGGPGRAARVAPTRCRRTRWSASPCRRARRPGRGSSRTTPSRPSRRGLSRRPGGMPGPSSRTETTTRSGNASSSTQAGASSPTWAAHVVEAGARPTATISATAAAGSRTARPGAATRDAGAGARAAPAPPPGRRPRRGRRDRVLLADQRAQRVSPARRPAGRARPPRRPSSAPRRCTSASTCSTPSCTARASRARSAAAAAARSARPSRRGHPLQGVGHVADDRAADQEQEEVAVDWSGSRSCGPRGRPPRAARRRPARRAQRQWMAQANIAPITQKPGHRRVEARPLDHRGQRQQRPGRPRGRRPAAGGRTARGRRRRPRSRRRSTRP